MSREFDLEAVMKNGGECLMDGTPAKVVAADMQGTYPLLVVINNLFVRRYFKNGITSRLETDGYAIKAPPLTMLPEITERWFPCGVYHGYQTLETLQRFTDGVCYALKVRFEDGKPVDSTIVQGISSNYEKA